MQRHNHPCVPIESWASICSFTFLSFCLRVCGESWESRSSLLLGQCAPLAFLPSCWHVCGESWESRSSLILGACAPLAFLLACVWRELRVAALWFLVHESLLCTGGLCSRSSSQWSRPLAGANSQTNPKGISNSNTHPPTMFPRQGMHIYMQIFQGSIVLNSAPTQRLLNWLDVVPTHHISERFIFYPRDQDNKA